MRVQVCFIAISTILKTKLSQEFLISVLWLNQKLLINGKETGKLLIINQKLKSKR